MCNLDTTEEQLLASKLSSNLQTKDSPGSAEEQCPASPDCFLLGPEIWKFNHAEAQPLAWRLSSNRSAKANPERVFVVLPLCREL